ncbi:MAG: glucosamine-6-phosphate deaminase [Clostridiales bacterium]|jgi:glucosamine-6-phosphate deaminase|nr:glucosamine-6-phosphate deaminase [Clostridiales bacterium]
MDKLRVEILDSREALGRAAASEAGELLRRLISEKGEATAVFAAAPSQNEFLANLLLQDVDWTRVRALYQDEYVALDPKHPAGFGNFLDKAIFQKAPFMEVHYLRDGAPEEVIRRYGELLDAHSPDVIFLGVGENGHLAFNDPPVADFEDPARMKVVELDEICRRQQVNDKCFERLEDVPTHALTMTLSQIMNIPAALAMVPGTLKAEAIRRALEEEISTACPASILRRHPNAMLFLDLDSASKLTRKEASL